ncbi:MAG TPA: DnaA/Hda family protein [Chloroflexota bacterium]|nr:DnaA/Hda family protein [Chloroflexota bacterium]
MESLWEQVLAVLERDPEISRASYATWLKGTRLLARDGSRFTVAAQHTFAREKLERSYAAAIVRAVGSAAGETQPRVEFVVPGAQRAASAPDARALPLVHRKAPELVASVAVHPTTAPTVAAVASHNVIPVAPAVASLPAPALNPRFTFAAFLSGPETQLAVTAARAVADDPGGAFNPLVLHGATGMGKTHLLHAVGGATLRARPSAPICLLGAAQLASELEAAVDLSARAAVLARYAGASLLLLDDAHELAGRAGQKYALHLLEALVAAGGQVVCAADSPPRGIAGLDERLRAFLQSGLVAELSPPDDATRLAILRAKSELRAGASPRAPRRRATPQHVLRAVSLVFGVPVEALLAARRDRQVVVPRQVAMLLMREETGASLSEIGAALGGRDHTTIIHGCDKIARSVVEDARLAEHVDAARQVIAAATAAAQLDSA